MTHPSYISEQRFEADFLKGPVWRLDKAEMAQQAVAEARLANVRLMGCRLPEPDDRTGYLEAAGFRKVETLVSLARAVRRGVPMPEGVRAARSEDADAAGCRRVGEAAFTSDRYHADPDVPDEAADALKGAWAYNAVMARADRVFIYDEGNGILGFNACLLRGQTVVIDLIGVMPGRQGAGIGAKLLLAMDADYQGRADRVEVGTQLSNSGSLTFYKNDGFKEFRREQTWHWTV